MEVWGYIASVFVGVSLGLLGAGGSILTVPVMVYLFHIPVMMATSYSLFIVGITSLLGASYQVREGNVKGRVAMLFCLVSLLVITIVRNWILPRIPSQFLVVDGVPITSSFVSMILFSGLMITAARYMIRRQPDDTLPLSDRKVLPVVFSAVLVGLITGFLGAGGGFILIPSMVLFLGMPMKSAVGTSLLIIAVNSLVGFALDLLRVKIEWGQLGYITLFATIGILLGVVLNKKVSANQLKVSFGWFVLVIGIMILVKELAFLFIKV